MDEEPNITPTPILPDDYSDVATEESGAETERKRRFQRGGRKGGQKKMSRMGPVPVPEPDLEPREGETLEEFNERFQFEKANGKKVEQKEDDIPPHREVENGYEHDVSDPPEVDYQEEPEVICDRCKEKTSRSKSPTGIKSFNVKRAKSSGGRPFGVSVGTKSKKPEKAAAAKKKKKKPKKKSKKKAKKEDDDEEEESESSSEEDSDEEEEDPDAQKPVSIRLDLNLMVEIFLKAKIKGDVTITFL